MRTCSGLLYFSWGSETRMVRMRSAWKPASTPSTRRKLRMSSPAPTSKMTENATSDTTSTRRARLEALLGVPLRPPSFKSSKGVRRDACNAGASPKRIPVPNVIPMVKNSTRASILTSETRGSATAPNWIIPWSAIGASKSPVTPPRIASTTLSVSSCRTI